MTMLKGLPLGGPEATDSTDAVDYPTQWDCRTTGCSRRLPASAALPLPGAAERQRWTNPHGAGDEGAGLWEK